MAAPPDACRPAFRAAASPERVRLLHRFVAAQGWAGLAAGDHARHLAQQGLAEERFFWWLPGPSDEVLAVALLAQGVLGVLAPTGAAQPAARDLLLEQAPQLHRVVVQEGQVDCSLLTGFELHRRLVTVAPELSPAPPGLPPTRPARGTDAPALFELYDSVSWMRRESPEDWDQLLRTEPTWVAEIEGRVVAAARWSRSYGRAVEVGGVATHPGFRRRGAGTAVTRAAAAAALEQGRLTVLRYGDPELAPLYHGVGFQLVGRELVFYRGG